MNVVDCIRERYSEAEAARFAGYRLSSGDRQTIIEAGLDVLRAVPPSASVNACAHLSALWVASIRDHTSIPIHAVAGNLSIDGKRIYYSEQPVEDLRKAFSESSLAYDGHVWMAVPGALGDVSLFRSAYSHVQGHWFKELVTQKFGPKRGLLFGSAEEGMAYDPKFVLTDGEVTSLVKAVELASR